MNPMDSVRPIEQLLRTRDEAADAQRAAGEIAGRLGEEVARPLSAALERLGAMAAAGAIDRAGIALLRDEIERARRVGIMAQQLARLARGDLRQQPERLDLRLALREALQHRAAECAMLGLELRQRLQPAEVSADGPLLFGLLLAVLDWALPLAHGRIDLEVGAAGWPPHARLAARLARCAPDEADGVPPPAPPAGVVWRLLEQTAAVLGARVACTHEGWRSALVVDFAPQAAAGGLPTLADAEALPPPSLPPGTRVLVVAAERAVRHTVQVALRRLPLAIDSADTAEAALACCRDGAPQFIVHDTALAGLEPLRRRLQAEQPALVFIGVAESGDAVEVHQRGSESRLTVGREALVATLPAALHYGWRRAA